MKQKIATLELWYDDEKDMPSRLELRGDPETDRVSDQFKLHTTYAEVLGKLAAGQK